MNQKCSYEGCDREVYAGKDKCIFHTEKKTADDIAAFKHEFGKEWGAASFKEEVDFIGFIFPPDWDFHRRIFEGAANFSKSHFKGKVNFSDAEFRHKVDFTGATFEGDLDFTNAWFWQIGEFREVTFVGEVHFIWPGIGYPLRWTPDCALNFGTVHFEGINTKRGVLDFSNNVLREGCRVIFQKCYFDRIRLVRTDCTKIEFVDCSWPQVKRRVIVGDEFLARFDKEGSEEIRAERHKDPDWRLIGVTYNQLAKIARDRLDYPSVHHFDQGVMVMRRMERVPRRCWRKKWWDFEWPRPKENEDKDTLKRQDHHKETQGHGVACGKSETLLSKVSIWRRSFRLRPGRLIASPFYYFSWLSFYCYVSDYGRNVERTLFWLVSTVPIFALLYDLFLPSKAICSYWPQSVTLSLQVASINRHGIDIISNGGLLVNLVAILQVAITATLVALFLFSLRRRFKR